MAYASVRKTSIDYGVMEPASRDADVTIAALRLEAAWRDVGSWPPWAELLERDPAGNAADGEVVLCESRTTIAVSTEPGHIVACLGCEDLVVVHTPGATLEVFETRDIPAGQPRRLVEPAVVRDVVPREPVEPDEQPVALERAFGGPSARWCCSQRSRDEIRARATAKNATVYPALAMP